MKRLLLISPLAPGSMLGGDFYFRLPPLGPLKVAALTEPGWHVTILDEKADRLDVDCDADLVGISTMTPTANRAYEIAARFRQRGTKVVMGGIHVSQMPDEALRYCDSVVVGEAEELWPRALADFEKGALRPLYQHDGKFPSLDKLPRTNWGLYRSKRYLPVHFVETTRGCPHDCEFCAVTKAFGGKHRNRPIKDVEAELDSLEPFEGRFILRNAVFFVDDNIISNRAYARELLGRLADRKLIWFGQASVNVARDDEFLDLCQRSGCKGLFIGFETLSPQSLAAAGKSFNHPHEFLDLIHRIHDHGIGVDGSFVFGFDQDDDGVFDRTIEFVIRAKIEVGWFSILTPYPGTRLHHRLLSEGRLLTTNWSLYDANHVVFRPKQMSADRLLEGYHQVLQDFYGLPSILKRLWGSKAYKTFFYPMNLGFRQSVRNMLRQGEK